MADQGEQKRGDEQEQDGLGRDAAHGGGRDDTTGGSYGRSTGRAGDDPTDSSDAGTDAARARDSEGRRRGLEGRGFDAGTGYGGGGNASAYRKESGFGGQAGAGGAHIPRGTDEESDDSPERDRDGRVMGGIEDAVDPDATPDVKRRDPLR